MNTIELRILGNRISVYKDQYGGGADIVIQGEWTNKYNAFCNKNIIDFYGATLLGCPFPKEERSDLEEWVRKHWWHMEKMN